MMRVSVVGGAGYVGLVTAVGLAAIGHRVLGVDVDEARIESLRAGNSPLREDGLDPLLKTCQAQGRLQFSVSLPQAVEHAEVIVIAVGTPARTNGEADLSQVIQVAEALAVERAHGYRLVVVKSTVPVGTVDLVRTILSRHKVEGRDFDIAANPEFLREGQGLHDFFHPDRIVIGASSARAAALVRDLYAPVIERLISWPDGDAPGGPAVPVIQTDLASAQMTKYAANAFLAMRISFINEVAALCERVGADVGEVVRGLGPDRRIGGHYFEAGLGFGGPCLEKDLTGLIRIAEANQYEPRLLRAALERNRQQVDEIVGKIKQLTGYLVYRRVITVFGLAFKAGTNDTRNSAALRLIGKLQEEGAVVHAYDPAVGASAAPRGPSLRTFDDPYTAAQGAEVLVIATDWPEFREVDYERLKDVMLQPCIVDARNLLDAARLRDLGFRYSGVGIG